MLTAVLQELLNHIFIPPACEIFIFHVNAILDGKGLDTAVVLPDVWWDGHP